MFDNGQQRPSLSALQAPVPQLVFLGILGGLSLVAAIVFAAWAGSIDIWEYSDPSEIALKAGLGAWADILMVIGIVASVGAIVLDGVLHLFKRVVASTLGAKPTASTEEAA